MNVIIALEILLKLSKFIRIIMDFFMCHENCRASKIFKTTSYIKLKSLSSKPVSTIRM